MYECTRCGGSGVTPFRHIESGVCFACGGTGKVAYKGKPKTTKRVEPKPHSQLRLAVERWVIRNTGTTERQIRDVESGPYAGWVSIRVCSMNGDAQMGDVAFLARQLPRKGFTVKHNDGNLLFVR